MRTRRQRPGPCVSSIRVRVSGVAHYPGEPSSYTWTADLVCRLTRSMVFARARPRQSVRLRCGETREPRVIIIIVVVVIIISCSVIGFFPFRSAVRLACRCGTVAHNVYHRTILQLNNIPKAIQKTLRRFVHTKRARVDLYPTHGPPSRHTDSSQRTVT